jgi:hypothetical protein
MRELDKIDWVTTLIVHLENVWSLAWAPILTVVAFYKYECRSRSFYTQTSE